MTTEQLVAQIKAKNSFLCIGLDVDLNKIPQYLLKEEDPIFSFNKAIIDATHHLCVAYKPNTAFYEAYGIKGWMALEKTINYLNENPPIANWLHFNSIQYNETLKQIILSSRLLSEIFCESFPSCNCTSTCPETATKNSDSIL